MDSVNIMRELAERIVEAGLAPPNGVAGCSPEQVQEVERRAGVRLPGMYRAFLLTMGRGAGDFLRGSEIYYPLMLGMNEDAQDLLDESSPPLRLPDDAFVFFFHQGYQFGFFQASSGIDDPEVYRFLEGETAFQPLGHTFSAWLREAIEDEAKIHRRW